MRATAIRPILLGLALAGFALMEVACDRSEATKPPVAETAAPPIAVPLVTAESRALPGGVDVTGTLMADAQTEVAAEGAGRVLAVYVERGSVVKAGTVLARLDGEDARNQLLEAEAIEGQTAAKLGLTPGATFDPAETPDARKARASMEWAQADHDRYANLLEQNLVSRADFELRRSQLHSAKAQHDAEVNTARQLYQTLLAQRARTSVARKAAADTDVRAPWDGLIAEKHAQAGQFLQRGARIATLVRVDPLRVELAVPETAVGAVRRGQKVEFTVQAQPDQTFAGSVAYVGPSLKAESRALVVEAVVANREGRLSPGLFATARIELPSARPSVLVPVAAVRTDAGVSTAFVVKNDRAELRLVQLGRELPGGLLEITRGIVAGEKVVAKPVDTLGDGAIVTTLAEAR
ncbi:MAG: efflux RND transporter periplasmic adaptor subunit [Candidatus Rokubacteria bacterium]|nr:efflux RND transporter periplasmic adaptor subunit [Candidatus Rokubacteria bacterium]